MDIAALPDDVDTLKKILLSQMRKNEELSIKYRILEEKYIIAVRYQYVRKSEKWTKQDETQGWLFNEAEVNADTRESRTAVPSSAENTEDAIEVRGHKRKRKEKRPKIRLGEKVKPETVVLDVADEHKICACGTEKSKIGESGKIEVEIIPIQIKTINYVRPQYACKKCEGTAEEGIKKAVISAPARNTFIPKSFATPSFLAFIFAGKFEYGMPYFRMAKYLARQGIDILRATMCNLQIYSTGKMAKLIEMMKKDLLNSHVIHIDETTLKVISEVAMRNVNKKKSSSYMWVYLGYGNNGNKIILYQYGPGRNSDIPKKFLGNYAGRILTDDYSGYSFLDATTNIIHAGCWAHARRKFFTAYNVNKFYKSDEFIISKIRRLYAVERYIKKRSAFVRLEIRQKYSKPIIAEIKEWLDQKYPAVLPSSNLGKAISYALSNWTKLIKFLDDPLIPIDNNPVENAIRPFVIGRKNWLFSFTSRGARSSADMYSFIETAKANGLDPYWYLCYVFDKFPAAKNDDDLRKLLPMNVTNQNLADFQRRVI